MRSLHDVPAARDTPRRSSARPSHDRQLIYLNGDDLKVEDDIAVVVYAPATKLFILGRAAGRLLRPVLGSWRGKVSTWSSATALIVPFVVTTNPSLD
jgi:hypothetical protein